MAPPGTKREAILCRHRAILSLRRDPHELYAVAPPRHTCDKLGFVGILKTLHKKTQRTIATLMFAKAQNGKA